MRCLLHAGDVVFCHNTRRITANPWPVPRANTRHGEAYIRQDPLETIVVLFQPYAFNSNPYSLSWIITSYSPSIGCVLSPAPGAKRCLHFPRPSARKRFPLRTKQLRDILSIARHAGRSAPYSGPGEWNAPRGSPSHDGESDEEQSGDPCRSRSPALVVEQQQRRSEPGPGDDGHHRPHLDQAVAPREPFVRQKFRGDTVLGRAEESAHTHRTEDHRSDCRDRSTARAWPRP